MALLKSSYFSDHFSVHLNSGWGPRVINNIPSLSGLSVHDDNRQEYLHNYALYDCNIFPQGYRTIPKRRHSVKIEGKHNSNKKTVNISRNNAPPGDFVKKVKQINI